MYGQSVMLRGGTKEASVTRSWRTPEGKKRYQDLGTDRSLRGSPRKKEGAIAEGRLKVSREKKREKKPGRKGRGDRLFFKKKTRS